MEAMSSLSIEIRSRPATQSRDALAELPLPPRAQQLRQSLRSDEPRPPLRKLQIRSFDPF